MTNEVARYEPDTIRHLEQSDLIQLTRDLLGAFVASVGGLDVKTVDEHRLKEMGIVSKLVNAALKSQQTKMSFLKMTNVQEKVKAIKEKNS